ncbi:MAG: MOSC domain-containing protein [Acidimicrobiia bacterium]
MADGRFEGRVVGIYVAPSEGAPMEARDEVRALAGKGLEGDRYAIEAGTYSGKRIEDAQRAVTLIEREAVQGADAEHGIELAEGETRRNIVTEGVRLNDLVGQEFLVGGVHLRGFDLSHPCTYLEEQTRPGVRKALVDRGGLRAEILDDGPIRVGDTITQRGGSH